MHNYLRLCAMLSPEELAIIDAVMYNVALYNEPLKKITSFYYAWYVFFTTPKMKAKGALIVHGLALTEIQIPR